VIHALPNGQIHHARVEAVYPLVEPGSVTLVHSDGPYGLDKAAWDKVRDLAAWYRPHVAEWGRICAPSASVYLWNTAEGWAAIHPEMVVAGWTFRTLIVWDKVCPPLTLSPVAWPAVTEVCGFYTRGDATVEHPHHSPRRHAGPHIPAVTSVWRLAPGAYLDERLKQAEKGEARDGSMVYVSLHPCQKPLLFARRIVEASSRPSDLVFEPFGGTCRIAAACEDIARWEPEKARRYVCVEMDEDGRDYIPAVLAALRGEPTGGQPTGQTRLFVTGAA
jgi:DNA modification methylase